MHREESSHDEHPQDAHHTAQSVRLPTRREAEPGLGAQLGDWRDERGIPVSGLIEEISR